MDLKQKLAERLKQYKLLLSFAAKQKTKICGEAEDKKAGTINRLKRASGKPGACFII